jgi:4-amino-4-deoxy-L-arabinose transferase-like glycosyltransferase
MNAATRMAGPRRAPSAIAQRVRALAARIRRTPAPLALLLAVTALLGVAWSVVMPPFQGPDESDHFAYVQHLAETGSAPSSTVFSGAGSYSTEEARALDLLGLRATIANPTARPMWSEVDQRRWERFERQLPPDGRSNGEGADPAAKNPPLYYAYEGVAYRLSPDSSLLGRQLLTRLASVLLLLVTVGLTWVAVSELTQRTWARVLATGVVALQPQLTFIGAIVNPDILLVTVWTAFIALAVVTLNRGPTTARVLGLFALTALSPLTHGRGIALLPPLAAVLVLSWWRDRPSPRDVVRWLAGGFALLGVALIAFRLYTSGNGGGALYGGQVAAFQQHSLNVREFLSYVWQFYLPPLPVLEQHLGPPYGFRQVFVETFFGTFGSLDVRFPGRVYALLQVGSVLGLVALYTAAIVRRQELRARWHLLLGLAAVGVTGIAFLHVVSYLALVGGPDPIVVGRYLLPLIALFALAVTFVATSLPRRLGPPFAAVVLACGVLLQLAGLGLTAIRFYG